MDLLVVASLDTTTNLTNGLCSAPKPIFREPTLKTTTHQVRSSISPGRQRARTLFFSRTNAMQWLGTVRGRIGFAPICRLLIYGTGGLRLWQCRLFRPTANFDNGHALPQFPNFTETKTGWTAGGGIEYAISNHWTVRAEYLHYDLGDEHRTAARATGGVPAGPPFAVRYNFDTSGEIVRGGLNFKF